MKKAFTLVELLVVVLIIGILTAVALPMYQGAVDKSHWSTMLPGAKAIKDAQEAIRLTNGLYTSNMEDLDVTMSDNGEVNYSLQTINHGDESNVIRVTNSKLANVRLASYLDENPVMGGQLHCEAKTGDERATRLCEKLLMGQDLKTTSDGYTEYLLDQEIDKVTCDGVNRAWSKKNTKCFKTEKDRCVANGMPYNNTTGLCGYKGNSGTDEGHRLVIEEGATCQGGWQANCLYLQVNDGGECKSSANRSNSPCSHSQFNPGSKCTSTAYLGCNDSIFNGAICTGHEGACTGEFHNNSVCNATSTKACQGTFDSGSVCNGNAQYSCLNGTFKEGSRCVANQPGTCGSSSTYNALGLVVIYDGGCCEGQYCPADAPKC